MNNSTKTQSGRSRAVSRRKTKASGIAPLPTKRLSKEAPLQRVATTPSVRKSVVAPAGAVVVSEGREVAKQRRKQLMRGQNSASGQASVRTRTKPEPKAVLEPRAQSKTKPKRSAIDRSTARKTQVKSTSVKQSSGRLVSKARRKAKVKGSAGVSAYKASGNSASVVAKAYNPEASGRDIAKSVRSDRCKRGKSGCSTASSSSRKQRSRKNKSEGLADKVGFSKTLSGQVVSGALVGQGQLTGAEKGSCKLVSGTEYLGMEEFAKHCSDVPVAGSSKVTTTQTAKGQSISGSRIGQAKSVTGDRVGQCAGVTGTEYLPSDQSDLFCGATSAVSSNVASGFTVNQAILSGVAAANPGSANKVRDGNDSSVQSGSIQPASREGMPSPEKVVISSTFAGNKTSGTQVGRVEAVTGINKGYCQSVTGTGYQGKEEFETKCLNDVMPKNSDSKVDISGTFSSTQNVTGDRSSTPLKSIGSSKGNFPLGNLIDRQSNVKQNMQPVEASQGHALTGTQPGVTGLTGAQAGACELVTGTQYQGMDQTSLICQGLNASTIGESDFPIMIADAPVGDMSQPLPSVESMLSGDSVITGDGWDSGSKVTGNGGSSAASRNPTIRGHKGQTPLSAVNFRPHSMEEVPPSPITGSAGNTHEGAKVTLSGGARA